MERIRVPLGSRIYIFIKGFSQTSYMHKENKLTTYHYPERKQLYPIWSRYMV